MVNVEYVAQHVAKYIFARLGKHLNIDANYQRRITEKAVTSACDLYRVCKGVTLKGSRCSRHVAGDAEYCFQHRGATMANDNPRHRSAAEEETSGSSEESSEEESSGSDEESSDDEGTASEGESSGSEEESMEEDTEEESEEDSSEEDTEDESCGESSDEEVPPPKKAKKTKKTSGYRTTVEASPDLPLQQKGTPLVREFVRDKDRLACAFLEAVRDVSRETSGEVSRNPDLPKDEDVIYRWLTVKAITAITQINNTGQIMYDVVDTISRDLGNGIYVHMDLDRLAQQISHNLGMDA